MTEEERIKQIARRFGDALHDRLVEEGIETGMATMYANFLENGVARGLEWANANPPEGWVNIDKACEFLKKIDIIKYSRMSLEHLANDFRKAMEG